MALKAGDHAAVRRPMAKVTTATVLLPVHKVHAASKTHAKRKVTAHKSHAAVSLSTVDDTTRPTLLMHKVQAASTPRLVKVIADATSTLLAHKIHATSEPMSNVKMPVPLAHTA